MPRRNELWAQFTLLSRGVKKTSCLYRWSVKRREFPISSNNNTISEAVQIACLPTNAHLCSYSASRNKSVLTRVCVVRCWGTCLVRRTFHSTLIAAMKAQNVEVWACLGCWVVTSCKLVQMYRHFRGTCCLKAVYFHQNTRHHSSDNSTLPKQ